MNFPLTSHYPPLYYYSRKQFIDEGEHEFKGPNLHPAGKVETFGVAGKPGKPGRSKKHRKKKSAKKAN